MNNSPDCRAQGSCDDGENPGRPVVRAVDSREGGESVFWKPGREMLS
jgi:hypothetical protein